MGGFDASACVIYTGDPRIETITVTGNGDHDGGANLDGLSRLHVHGNGAVHLADVETEGPSVSIRGNGEDTDGSGTAELYATVEADIRTSGNATVTRTGGAAPTGDGEGIIR